MRIIKHIWYNMVYALKITESVWGEVLERTIT